MKTLLRILTICLLVVPTSLFAQGTSDDKGRTILIFDASGSMWGKLGSETKIEIARKTTLELIKSRPAQLELGLMAYGHRRKGDCDDIELLVTAGSKNEEALTNAVLGLIPRGKTPIFKSVLMAAEKLAYTEKTASVILISDGIETCGGDLDALGKLLAEKGLDFKTHIIGFAMADEDTVALRGLAKATGGIYADAGDAESLAKALKTATEAAAKPATTLTLVPLDQDGKSLLKNGVDFSIHRNKGNETPLLSGQGGRWISEIEAGDYHVTAKFGEIGLEAEVKVIKERDTTHTFTFAAPVLTLQALMKEGGEPLAGGVSWHVYGKPNAEGKRPEVAKSYQAESELRLAPGEYQVTAKRGATKVSKDLVFTDQPQTLTVILGAGTVKLTATSTEGGEPLPSQLTWRILGDPDAEGQREELAKSYDAQPTFTLPAGSYQVAVSKGKASATGEIEIKPGELATASLVLGEGTLMPRMKMSADQEEAKKGSANPTWEVYGEANEEEKRPFVTRKYGLQSKFTLPAGSYLLHLKLGKASVSQEIEIKAGQVARPLLNLNASYLQPIAIMSEGAEAYEGKGLKWSVWSEENAEGKREHLSSSYDAKKTFILPVGKYLLQLKRDRAETEQEVEVVANTPSKPTLNLNAGILEATLAGATKGKIKWGVYSTPDAEGKANSYGTSRKEVDRWVLPVGKYELRLVVGKETIKKEVSISAGKLNKVAMSAGE